MGFFVVLVVKGDDTDCNGLLGSNLLRTKNVTLIIKPTITKHDYIIASGSVVAVALLFFLTYVTAVIVFNIREGKKLERQELLNEQEQSNIDAYAPSPSITGEVTN